MSKIRIDWSVASFTAVPAVIVGTVLGLMGYEAYQMRPYIKGRPAESIDVNGHQYRIANPDTVSRNGNANEYNFDFNLAGNTVMIHDGHSEGFRDFETFEGFGRPQEFEQARQAGCMLAQRTYNYASGYDPGEYIGDNEGDEKQKDAEKSLAFIKKFCSPG